ncbi:RNA polymerase factor sigma-54 [Thermotoga caldifontis]|uniref:RNA polymerase factor sigma-54 n=1 Tax=Thermotoga caldifontis TaxID=1508419 RepID=UPI000694F78B|nr:hypothetical protein [Thermotoga caldifontis]
MKLKLDLTRDFSSKELFFKFVELPVGQLAQFLQDFFPYISLDLEDTESESPLVERLLSGEKSLQEELMDAIALLRLDERQEPVAEYIVYNLDERGNLLVDEKEICEKFSISLEELEKLLEAIKDVGPEGLFEGSVSGFGRSATYVQPDVVIREDLSVHVKELAVSSGGSDKRQEKIFLYINELLQHRKEIMFCLGNMIVRKNVDFLLGRSVYPNKTKFVDAAEELGLHVSTVSKAVSQKYVKTPSGIFPMHTFFGRNIEVKFFLPLLYELLKENPRASDEKLRILLRERGIEVSRRTVNKYRNLLGGLSRESGDVLKRRL